MKDNVGEARRWLRQSKHDLEFGRLALREGYLGQACFVAFDHAQRFVTLATDRLGGG